MRAETEAPSPLLRALTKLGTALGEGAEQAVDVRLGTGPADTLGVLRDALERGVQVELAYYSYGRDELSERRVEPAKVFSDQGNWYLSGWCHRADGERVFRLDRIRTAVVTDIPVEHSDAGVDGAFTPSNDDPRVTLQLAPTARWVVEQYPVESVDDDGEHLIVTMAVSAGLARATLVAPRARGHRPEGRPIAGYRARQLCGRPHSGPVQLTTPPGPAHADRRGTNR